MRIIASVSCIPSQRGKINQSFFIHRLMHKRIVLKTILKFTLKLTLKQLRHILVQSPSSGSALFELAKASEAPCFGRHNAGL
jgi:phage terminase large subunit-like protein